jgi:hypothetical protein
MPIFESFDDAAKAAAERAREMCYAIDPPLDDSDVDAALTLELRQAQSSITTAMTYLSRKSDDQAEATAELIDAAAHSIRAAHYSSYLTKIRR